MASTTFNALMHGDVFKIKSSPNLFMKMNWEGKIGINGICLTNGNGTSFYGHQEVILVLGTYEAAMLLSLLNRVLN